MNGLTSEIVGSVLQDWTPPSQNATICDIGGGLGHVLIKFAQHYPDIKGTVLDLPSVVERTTKFIEENELAPRRRAIAGSFLEPYPPEFSECDVFYLKQVLHNWGGELAVTILKQIAAVAKPGASLLATEFILAETRAPQEHHMSKLKSLADVNMLACFAEG
ncbi:hypothetical protein CYMTET_44544 [Cymbomonas tetramitiformis]|uniref:O-methyltransferase C-terminal domain-containing protein n=1 Tax=Cymbomonas tetramitiformis TaxID=36881 RepID=A0AAE0C178_9CHLO|nr:hypothetical protein CYMTET_44544 [Cymbomonas tetramitiformis]